MNALSVSSGKIVKSCMNTGSYTSTGIGGFRNWRFVQFSPPRTKGVRNHLQNLFGVRLSLKSNINYELLSIRKNWLLDKLGGDVE